MIPLRIQTDWISNDSETDFAFTRNHTKPFSFRMSSKLASGKVALKATLRARAPRDETLATKYKYQIKNTNIGTKYHCQRAKNRDFQQLTRVQ